MNKKIYFCFIHLLFEIKVPRKYRRLCKSQKFSFSIVLNSAFSENFHKIGIGFIAKQKRKL